MWRSCPPPRWRESEAGGTTMRVTGRVRPRPARTPPPRPAAATTAATSLTTAMGTRWRPSEQLHWRRHSHHQQKDSRKCLHHCSFLSSSLFSFPSSCFFHFNLNCLARFQSFRSSQPGEIWNAPGKHNRPCCCAEFLSAAQTLAAA